jgi:pantoate kinase
MRAFEASGKTAAEFAEMYGLDPSEVAQAIERVQRSRQA